MLIQCHVGCGCPLTTPVHTGIRPITTLPFDLLSLTRHMS